MLPVKQMQNPHSALTDDTLIILPKKTKTIATLVDHPSEWNTTGTETPLENVTETAILVISHQYER